MGNGQGYNILKKKHLRCIHLTLLTLTSRLLFSAHTQIYLEKSPISYLILQKKILHIFFKTLNYFFKPLRPPCFFCLSFVSFFEDENPRFQSKWMADVFFIDGFHTLKCFSPLCYFSKSKVSCLCVKYKMNLLYFYLKLASTLVYVLCSIPLTGMIKSSHHIRVILFKTVVRKRHNCYGDNSNSVILCIWLRGKITVVFWWFKGDFAQI